PRRGFGLENDRGQEGRRPDDDRSRRRAAVVRSRPGGRTQTGPVRQMLLPTFEKLLETLVPSRRMATIATTAMRATRRPYSTSEAPASSLRSNFASSQVFRMNRSIVVVPSVWAVWCGTELIVTQRVRMNRSLGPMSELVWLARRRERGATLVGS